jgi:hypothetical protein
MTPSEITATLRAEPAEAEVGQPVLWILDVRHPAGATVRLPEIDSILGETWVLLEPRRVVRGSETTTATWSVLALEPGDRPLPSLTVQVEADGVARSVEVSASTLSVGSALSAGEDVPRPIRGFHPAPERTSGTGIWLILAVLSLVAAAALGAWLRRRARKKAPAAALPTPLERLAELSRQSPEDPEAARRTIYALTRLLRESCDRALGEDRAALVDADWAQLRETDERLPLGSRTTIARILRDAESVKYALHAPTRFALEALIADARNALEALAEATARLEKAA